VAQASQPVQAKEDLRARYDEMVDEAMREIRVKITSKVNNLVAKLREAMNSGATVKNSPLDSVRSL
jgi:hypothetical protein